ncbi:MAG: acetylornithine deacetylase [Acetobacteraceae bacterium]|nr:acetylornithine deacetylase [Acetobacteraceae bacterium]
MSQTPSPGPRYSSAELLDRLVSFDTTSRNSNLELIGFVRSYLDAHAIAYRISTDETGRKANIHATVGGSADGGLALSGHVDTVPVDGQSWTSNPFAVRDAGDRYYGRGTADMKGFVASALASLPDIQAKRFGRPLHLFITYDEETTCNGARRIIEDIRQSGYRPECCVVGEPTSMAPVIAHKGRLVLRVSVRGAPGHSSRPKGGVNAIYAAAAAITHAAAEADRFAAEGPFEDGFDPPHTTVHVGTVEGGTILNIIPEHAAFSMEWRTVPADDFLQEVERFQAFVRRSIEPGMRDGQPDSGFTFEIDNWIPGLSLPPDHPLATAVKHAAGANASGKVSYGTEAGLYAKDGIPTIICGPGDIAQAHRPDEWLAHSQLAACDAFIRRLADQLLG